MNMSQNDASDWTLSALSQCEHLGGTELVAHLVHAVMDRVDTNRDVPNSRLVADALDDISSLSWQCREHGLELNRHYEIAGLENSFRQTGDDIVSIMVSSLLYLDTSRYSYDYLSVRNGLSALDASLPSGAKMDDFAVVNAIEKFARVGEIGAKALARSLEPNQLDEHKQNALSLPSSSDVRAIATEINQQGNDKAVDWLLHSVMLLPARESSAGILFDDYRSFLETLIDLADDILADDDCSDGRKSVVYYRRSRALYALNDIDGALRDIDQAMRLMDRNQVQIFDQYHTQLRLFEQERSSRSRISSILAESSKELDNNVERALHETQKRIEALAAEARETSRQQVSDALFRVVEILGLFMALIGLLASTIGTAIFAEGDIVNRIWLLLVGFVGTAVFYLLLRIIVGRQGLRFWRPDHHDR